MDGLAPTLFVVLLLIIGVVLIIHGFDSHDAYTKKREEKVKEEEALASKPVLSSPPFTIGATTRMAFFKRNQHHLITSPTGTGKTEFLKHMLVDDLRWFNQGKCSIVVIDTKGDLIDDLLETAEFCATDPIIIDPRDADQPFNLGFVDFNRIKRLPTAEREMAYNGAITMLTTTLSGMGDEMTAKQEGMFGYVFKLMELLPSATLIDLYDILVEGSDKYREYIDQLDQFDQQFFYTLYYQRNGEYEDTKKQVARRIAGMLSNPVLKQAFTSKQPPFDFRTALDDGSVILVNISTKILKGYSATFGRFILAKLLQAVEEREGRGRSKLTVVYADEAQEYLDASARRILQRGRSANLGLVAVMPDFESLDGELKNVILRQTLTKSISRMGMSDARAILATTRAPVDPEEIRQLRDGAFYTFSHEPLSYLIHEPRWHDTYWSQGYYEPVFHCLSPDVRGLFDQATTEATDEEIERVKELSRSRYGIEGEPPVFQSIRKPVEQEDTTKKARRKPRKSKKSDPSKAEPFDL